MEKKQNTSAQIISLASDLRWSLGEGFHDKLAESIYSDASKIADRVVTKDNATKRFNIDRSIDKILTSRAFGFPTMILILSVVLWITISGANVPSALLAVFFLDTIHPLLKGLAASIGLVWWIDGFLIDGVYLALAWVISVMLPPMAIFFPLFTLLEDLGYLPRVAFNMDKLFHNVGAHGKQALTMSMGWGCNAAGVVATRIIDSPRERLIAIITNNFALCNGRWPTQILIASIFIGAIASPYLAGLISAFSVLAIAMLGVLFTFGASWLLSRTVLKGEVSTFNLELPPYRPPRILKTLYTSLIDRTMIVLWRACVFAAPAGGVIWLVSNVYFGDQSVATWLITSLDGFGWILGLNGVILLAYIVAIPANEIVVPTILMLTVMTVNIAGVGEGAGVMFELDSMHDTGAVLKAGGWSLLTGVNLMLFSLLHNPCSTTLYTIYKETNSWKWTMVSAILPLILGIAVCFMVAQVWRIFTG